MAKAPSDMMSHTYEELATSQAEAARLRAQVEELEAGRRELEETVDAMPYSPLTGGGNSEYAHGIGKYIIPMPRDNTLVWHARMVNDARQKLDYWPNDDGSNPFDTAIAKHYPNPALNNPAHPNYAEYETVRDQLAIVRNYLMMVVLNGIDTNDPKQQAIATRKLEEMGRTIGKALQNDQYLGNPLARTLRVRDVSYAGAGAAEIYNFLERTQESGGGRFGWLRKLIGKGTTDWGLPPREETPFNDANLAYFNQVGMAASPVTSIQPLPADQTMHLPNNNIASLVSQGEPIPQEAPAYPAFDLASTAKLVTFASAMLTSALATTKVLAMPEPARREAIVEAEYILRRLRETNKNTTTDQWQARPPEAVIVDNENLMRVAETYAQSYQNALAINPDIARDPALHQSNAALGALTYLAQEQALVAMHESGDMQGAAALKAQMDALPAEWRDVSGIGMADLLAHVEGGLQHTQNIIIDAHTQAAQRAAARGLPKGVAALSPDVLRGLNVKPATPEELSQAAQTQQAQALARLKAAPSPTPSTPQSLAAQNLPVPGGFRESATQEAQGTPSLSRR